MHLTRNNSCLSKFYWNTKFWEILICRKGLHQRFLHKLCNISWGASVNTSKIWESVMQCMFLMQAIMESPNIDLAY